MAVTQTTRFQLYRWSSGADQFTRAQMTESHDNLEAEGAGYSQAGSRPAAAAEYEGFFHYDSTDSSVGTLSYCNGTAWFDVGAPGSVTSLDGATSDGTSNFFARADHTHALDNSIVTTDKINDLAVTTGKLNDLAVTTGKLDDLAVTNAKLASTGLDASKFTEGTLPAARIGSGTITNDKLGTDLNADKLSAGTLSPDRIDDGDITNAKLADMNANTVKIRQSSTGAPQNVEIGANQVLGRSGSGTLQSVQIAEDMIVNNAVTTAKMEQVAGHGILARVAGTTGNLSELTAGTNTVLNRGASGNLQFTSVTNAMLAGSITKEKISSVNASAVTGELDAGNIGNDTIALGTKTTGNYVATVQAGQISSTDGIDVSISGTEGSTVTIKHHNTSSEPSSLNSDGTVIQDISLDTYGHITDIGVVNLDGRYYRESEVDTITNDLYGDSGHTNGRRIYISSTEPAAGTVGNIWFET